MDVANDLVIKAVELMWWEEQDSWLTCYDECNFPARQPCSLTASQLLGRWSTSAAETIKRRHVPNHGYIAQALLPSLLDQSVWWMEDVGSRLHFLNRGSVPESWVGLQNPPVCLKAEVDSQVTTLSEYDQSHHFTSPPWWRSGGSMETSVGGVKILPLLYHTDDFKSLWANCQSSNTSLGFGEEIVSHCN